MVISHVTEVSATYTQTAHYYILHHWAGFNMAQYSFNMLSSNISNHEMRTFSQTILTIKFSTGGFGWTDKN